MTTLPTYFLSHGGGPWPYIKEMAQVFAPLAASLQALPAALPEPPRALLVVTAHWEGREFLFSSAAKPGMIYDYSGFPPHTYQITYGAPGEPELARRAQSLLAEAGIEATLDDGRGYDHGTFVPLTVMYPKADVPVVQMSILMNYAPDAHIAAGRALAPLRREGVLILGSGLSYHNLGRFGVRAQPESKAFDVWLDATLSISDTNTRLEKLLQWSQAPGARAAHPREDHLIPLFVALGAAKGEPATRIYHEEAFMGGITVSSFRFG
ncbi:MAG: class III extradiol ring-cleavage dioxygenase [Proteobacteria bacterium]|nr:class III extradiol ring-cleavage dioxygenase [Pseudomonadota bacterium]